MWDSDTPTLHTLNVADARAEVDKAIGVIGTGPPVASVAEVEIDVGDVTIPARVYEPASSTADLVWFHGGGWVVAGLDTHDAMCRMLANAAQCTVTSVAYRLAPEHQFPIPLEDCWTALVSVARRTAERPLIVGGDSAGGNLAAVCAIRAREGGGPALALQVLIYPVTDCAMDTASYADYGGKREFLTGQDMAWFFDHYAPNPAERRTPEISPLRTPDLTGLPPTVLVTAGHDPLLDEDLAYIARLREAHVEVVHRHYGDVTHAFFSFVNVFERGNEAIERVGQDIRAAMGAWTQGT
jgi:acetyl esterase